MSRNKQFPDEQKTTQELPTEPAQRDAAGFELDSWGLPICGPARIERLAVLGLPDPNFEPEAWAAQAQKALVPVISAENSNG